MKVTIVEQLANRYAKHKYKDSGSVRVKQAVSDFIEGWKSASLLLDEIVNDFDINDFFNGKKTADEV